jgi:branched-chain amino acid transport system permease protein
MAVHRLAARPEALLRRAWPLGSLVALVLLVAVAVPGISGDLEGAVGLALINIVLVVGLYTFVGTSGVMSFGHVTYMAIGAYTCGILTIPTIARPVLIPNVPGFVPDTAMATVPAVLIGGAVAALAGLLVGIPIVRLNGIAAGIALFAVLLVANVIFNNWELGTGGAGTLTRVPTDLTVTGNAGWGLRLRGAREDEPAARSTGVGVTRERLGAMTLSAFLTGIGGALYTHYVGSFSADSFFLSTTFLLLAMLVVGGINSLAGAVCGTLVISAVSYVLDRWTNGLPVGPLAIHIPTGTREIFVAVLMLVILLLWPDGITRGRELPLPARRRAAGWPGAPTPILEQEPR